MAEEKKDTVASRLIDASRQEQATRPVIGGKDETPRQSELNAEVGLDPAIVKAKADLAVGKTSPEKLNEIAGTHR